MSRAVVRKHIQTNYDRCGAMSYEMLKNLESAQLENTETTIFAHMANCCSGACPLHNRSNHHMRGWPQHWRSDRGIIERVCPHGIGHPDPDDYRFSNGFDTGSHGCDGCCHSDITCSNDECNERGTEDWRASFLCAEHGKELQEMYRVDMEESVTVDGIEYVKDVINGKEVLVRKDDTLKVTLELTRQQAEFIYTSLVIISDCDEFDLNYSGVVWFSDYWRTFTDEAVRQAQELVNSEEWLAIYKDGDYDFFDKFITTMAGKK